MSIRVVRLGTPRLRGEGVRLGTVRRPPRGVRKSRYAADDWFDVWLPNLAPSPALVRTARESQDAVGWRRFSIRYKAEMAQPENSRVIDVLAALSHHANFSVGCYCEDEERCHRSVLRKILKAHGAALAD
jgi:uncharacterized protein YeaO (DUF488 family)